MLLKRVADAASFDNFKRIGDAIDKLLKSWFLTGVEIEITLAVGDNDVRHGLGRPATKVIPVYQDAASSFFYGKHADSKNYVVVNSSAVTTAKFYVD